MENDFKNFLLLNSAYTTLIPKKEDASHAKDYKPINLIHSFARLVMKILANRLANKLDNMVSKNQTAYVKERFIHDNFMLVQQTTRFLHSQKQPRIILKLDISKAIDSMSWAFSFGGTAEAWVWHAEICLAGCYPPLPHRFS
jgi:hypothetical protein